MGEGDEVPGPINEVESGRGPDSIPGGMGVGHSGRRGGEGGREGNCMKGQEAGRAKRGACLSFFLSFFISFCFFLLLFFVIPLVSLLFVVVVAVLLPSVPQWSLQAILVLLVLLVLPPSLARRSTSSTRRGRRGALFFLSLSLSRKPSFSPSSLRKGLLSFFFCRNGF